MNFKNFSVKPDSALFIDRDGVINKLRHDDYVKQISEFELLEGVTESFEILKPIFSKVFIVTNQQGIGKGLMIDDIEKIHNYFLNKIPKNIQPDKIYYCPHLKEQHCVCRKPHTGMALIAKNDFPEINLKNSIMIGDSISDIDFAKNAGMTAVFISENLEKCKDENIPVFKNLYSFAKFINGK
ncbi:MAG: HAD-IIIA family hydrolase [Bacteroidetes bacterium]|nr:HAD-IIIA family hydrolase [Bacteroidota bacterium]